jgi:hypothetical protein
MPSGPTEKLERHRLAAKFVARILEADHKQQLTWLLHHDNAPPHTSILTQPFLAKNKFAVTPHPPYSPDLAQWDFFLFPKMKLKLK